MFFDDNIGFFSLMESTNNSNLFDSKEGFVHGNMFRGEYDNFKNYQPKPVRAKTEKEGYLFKIMELNFAINDLNLYLDLHPEDMNVYDKFKRYVTELIEVEGDYVKKYGPLKIDETLGSEFSWINCWPWEGDDSKYV